VGREAAAVREEALQRDREARSGQMPLLVAPLEVDPPYEAQHAVDVTGTEVDVLAALAGGKRITFEQIWPGILERRHVTVAELRGVVRVLRDGGRVRVENAKPRERAIKDEHVLVAGVGA